MPPDRRSLPLARQVSGMRIGIVGMGRIGRLTAGWWAALGTRVKAYDPFATFDNVTQASLDEVIEDLHLMLLDPSRFLLDKEPIYDELGNPLLSFREYKLYGRDDEVSLIEEAFCRVSVERANHFSLVDSRAQARVGSSMA